MTRPAAAARTAVARYLSGATDLPGLKVELAHLALGADDPFVTDVVAVVVEPLPAGHSDAPVRAELSRLLTA